MLKFRDALSTILQENYENRDWIQIPGYFDKYRYIFGTAGKNPLITVGINPSMAGVGNLDATLKTVEKIALKNGFDSFLMFNVYAERALNTDDIDMKANIQLHQENMEALRWVLQNLSFSKECPAPVIWAAWGSNIEKRPYLINCLIDIVNTTKKFNARWCKAGELSEEGHPRHPKYLSADTEVEFFDIGSYVKKLIEPSRL